MYRVVHLPVDRSVDQSMKFSGRSILGVQLLTGWYIDRFIHHVLDMDLSLHTLGTVHDTFIRYMIGGERGGFDMEVEWYNTCWIWICPYALGTVHDIFTGSYIICWIWTCLHP